MNVNERISLLAAKITNQHLPAITGEWYGKKLVSMPNNELW
jgi:hypothetical protein